MVSGLLFRRGVRRGLLTLVREREYGTTLGVLFGVAFLAQLLVLATMGMQSVHGVLRSQLDLRLQVRDTAVDQQVQEFLVALRDQPSVTDVRYVTREEAYENERRRDPQLTSFLEEFQIENPFPDTVAVSLKSLQDYEAFAAFTRDAKWKDVVDPAFLSQTTGQEQEVRQMLRLTEAVNTMVLAFLALTSFVLLFVLMELVRRRALSRKEEILVERLSGAQDVSVLVPFATEAAVLLFAAVALSAIAMAALLLILPIVVPAIGPGGPFAALRSQMLGMLAGALPFVGLLELLLVPALAAGGAYLGMRSQFNGGRLALS